MRLADALNPGMAIHVSRAELTDKLSVGRQHMSGYSLTVQAQKQPKRQPSGVES